MIPFVTIIIPTYNRKELLEKAVLSVLSQKQDIAFEYEIIIIDDGSRDGTENFIKDLVNDPANHITYRYQENGGVGKARNHGLSLMNPKSDYLIFLDSDDELFEDIIMTCLGKWEVAKNEWIYDRILGYYFLCKDENGTIIGSDNILGGKESRSLTYDDYLHWAIDREMGLMTKSQIFTQDPRLRFEEDITTEGVMWAKMWKYMGEHDLEIRVLQNIGRLYRVNHTGEIRITKTLSWERFKKNAIGNERVLEVIWNDLEKKWLTHYHADLLMRTGINWILAGEKSKWLSYLRASLAKEKNAKTFILLVLASIHKKIIYTLYSMYV